MHGTEQKYKEKLKTKADLWSFWWQ